MQTLPAVITPAALYQSRADQIWTKVERLASGCWFWSGGRNAKGYGRIKIKNHYHFAHRASFAIVSGVLPGSLFVCHRCDNPPCVNPDHLFLGTNGDNLRDMWAKGRGFTPFGGRRPGHNRGETNPLSKLTEQAVREIRASDESREVLARRFGVHPSTIKGVLARRAWSHVQ